MVCRGDPSHSARVPDCRRLVCPQHSENNQVFSGAGRRPAETLYLSRSKRGTPRGYWPQALPRGNKPILAHTFRDTNRQPDCTRASREWPQPICRRLAWLAPLAANANEHFAASSLAPSHSLAPSSSRSLRLFCRGQPRRACLLLMQATEPVVVS